MLYYAGALQRMGNVDSGDTTMDYLPAERERGITINSAAISFDWKGAGLFLVDSPGHLDFTYEVQRALRVMDSVVVVLDAVAGVQPQTETVWRQADAFSLPRIVFVNKMDRDGADFDAALSSLRSRLGASPLPLHFPIVDSRSGSWLGFIDLLTLERVDRTMPLSMSDESRPSKEETRVSLDPESLDSKVAAARERLVENLAEVDDDVMEAWLGGEKLTTAQLRSAVRRAAIACKVVPVLCGSALKNTGVPALLDAVVEYLPSASERQTIDVTSARPVREHGDLLALAFKVTHDKHRGQMVYMRAFCGGLDRETSPPLFNVSNGKKELPTGLLRVMADTATDAGQISTGDIFAAVGMKHTRTGDTVSTRRPKGKTSGGQGDEYVLPLEGMPSPPAVISVSIEAESTSQQRQLDIALDRLLAEDPSLRLSIDARSGETLLSGMGQLHLDVVVDRLSQSLPDPIYVSKPRVAYRETIRSSVHHKELYNEAIGATRHSAKLSVELNPLAAPFESDNNDGGNRVILPDDVIAQDVDLAESLSHGVLNALERGPLLGAPASRVEAVITSTMDDLRSASSRAALLACANKAIRQALARGDPVILEPLMNVTCSVPDSMMGAVIAELTHPVLRRGVVDDVERVNVGENEPGRDGVAHIRARVPLAGMVDWATRQRSITKGRGDFSMEVASYYPVGDAHQEVLLSMNRQGHAANVGG